MLWMLAPCIAATPMPVPWATDEKAERFRIALVGSLPEQDQIVAGAVRSLEPDITVFTSLEPKRDLEAWAGGPVMAFPANGKANKAWLKRFVGVGVPGLPRTVPYGHIDLVADETRWRIVYLTTSTSPVGRWEEQAYWLPGVLDDSAFDRLLVFADGARHTLSEVEPSQRGGRVLLDRVQDAVDPLAFVGWVGGNTFTNEVFTPGGRFGELHVNAGASGGKRVPFARAGKAMPGVMGKEVLEPGFDGALVNLLGDQPRFEVDGFWMVELQGARVQLDFHHDRGSGHEVVYRVVRDGTGWHLP